MYKKFQQFWGRDKSLLILLIILSIHMFVILPFGQKTAIGKILFFSFYIFLLIAGLKYLAGMKKFGLMLIVSFICFALLSTRLFSDQGLVLTITDIGIIFYWAMLAWIVLAKTFSKGPITIYRIEGSIVGYLIIGFIFSNLYNLIFHLRGESAFNGMDEYDLKEFLYFSLTTLTTVGYGDISPALPASRSLANIEALIGQLYPAILIARLVSMQIADRGARD